MIGNCTFLLIKSIKTISFTQINNNQIQDILKSVLEPFLRQSLLISIRDNGGTLENKTFKAKQNIQSETKPKTLPPWNRSTSGFQRTRATYSTE